MVTGDKEVAAQGPLPLGGQGACASSAACSNWPASQSGRGGARRSHSSGPRGHIGEGKLKPRFCPLPHFD